MNGTSGTSVGARGGEHHAVTRRDTLAWSVAASAAGLIGAATGCGPVDRGTGATQSAEPATIHFALRSGQETAPFRGATQTFRDKQSRIKVEFYEAGQEDFYTKVAAAFAAAVGPDVSFATSRQLLPWQSKKFIADITTGLTRRKVKTSDWYPLAAQEWQAGGKQFGVPQGWGTIVSGINKTLFKNASVTLRPNFDEAWNHDEFVRMLKQVVKVGADGNLETWGISKWAPYCYFWSFGAEVLNAGGTRAALNTAQGIAAFQWLYDVAWSHRVMPRGAPHDRPVGGADMWRTGQQALADNGGPTVRSSWPTQLNFEYDVIFYPIGPAGRHHLQRSDGWVMAKESKQPEAALDFLAYLATEGQIEIERQGGRQIPAYRPAAEGPFLQGNSPFTRQKWLDAAKTAKLGPQSVAFEEIDGIVTAHQANMLAQKETARDAIAAIEREINVVLSQAQAQAAR